ncbi:MAG: hypothetical protein VX719_04900, partial [Pseudomonadota bacterium]|nr:hypothetical protein [Pseudomonadota bacterium]
MVSRIALLLALPLAVACAPVAGGEDALAPPQEASVPGALLVAGKFGNTLSKVDLASGSVTITVDSCANPHELATSPDAAHV